jgi:hypothetical protein
MKDFCYKMALALAFTVAALVSHSIAGTQPGPIKYLVKASCLTETRNGKTSCWGIVVNFDKGKFKRKIRSNELTIYEAKHGANITNLMTCHTTRDGKQLTIKFKRGTGDFGTGNQAQIRLYKSAFAVAPNGFPDYIVFVQKTDLN